MDDAGWRDTRRRDWASIWSRERLTEGKSDFGRWEMRDFELLRRAVRSAMTNSQVKWNKIKQTKSSVCLYPTSQTFWQWSLSPYTPSLPPSPATSLSGNRLRHYHWQRLNHISMGFRPPRAQDRSQCRRQVQGAPQQQISLALRRSRWLRNWGQGTSKISMGGRCSPQFRGVSMLFDLLHLSLSIHCWLGKRPRLCLPSAGD